MLYDLTDKMNIVIANKEWLAFKKIILIKLLRMVKKNKS
ncbi:hypothetical protein NT04LS_3327 [Listeria seeligeri FSL S4-171]|nr:hypothetical protein NT04LS_3327 [Listeria seeligeri FSL S4-171]CBH27165.1 hypothetical protein lse_1014 [Listeria seeligeri serovar 1/2b str. SLCC3954]